MGSLGLWWVRALVAGPGRGGDAVGAMGNRAQGQGFVVQAGELGGLGLARGWPRAGMGAPADEAVPSPGKAAGPRGA